MIRAKLAEYLQNLLRKVHAIDPDFLDDLQILPIITKHSGPQSYDEVKKVNLILKDSIGGGTDNIPAQVIKHGGCALHRRRC